MAIRQPTREELTTLRRAFGNWDVFDYFADKMIYLSDSEGRNAVCVSTKAVEQIALASNVEYVGLEIGALHKKFIPTIAGADLFVKVGCNRKYCVVIGGHGQDLVLYGRDVMGESVIQASEDLSENEIVILLNESGDAVGIGRTRFDGTMLKQEGRVTITTLQDAGRYLREEGN